MSKSFGVPRSVKSWAVANTIIAYNLYEDFKIWTYYHPQIKSKYRQGFLFVKSKKLYGCLPDNYFTHSVNMDSLDAYMRD